MPDRAVSVFPTTLALGDHRFDITHRAVVMGILTRTPDSFYDKGSYWAFDDFLEKYGAKYPKACDCLRKDRRELLAFYAFPAEHWQHLRTTNPIESTFATIRLRHRKTKGSGTRRTSLAMMFKLAQSAANKWRRLSSHEKVTLVLQGRVFNDGILQDAAA